MYLTVNSDSDVRLEFNQASWKDINIAQFYHNGKNFRILVTILEDVAETATHTIEFHNRIFPDCT